MTRTLGGYELKEVPTPTLIAVLLFVGAPWAAYAAGHRLAALLLAATMYGSYRMGRQL